MSKVSVVIPARLGSTRLPGKVLADICGKPLLRHVWDRVSRMRRATETLIATDSEQVLEAAKSWGARAVMTSPECRSGTERIASILGQLKGDFIVNVQGDEPLIEPDLLDALIERWERTPCDLVTPVRRITDPAQVSNPNVVKVVRAQDGRALYFSRSAVPYVRDAQPAQWLERATFWGHIGVYGYTRAVVEKYLALPVSPLETAESLEQLRFVDAGYVFQTVETAYHPVAVDTPEDLERVRAHMAARA